MKWLYEALKHLTEVWKKTRVKASYFVYGYMKYFSDFLALLFAVAMVIILLRIRLWASSF